MTAGSSKPETQMATFKWTQPNFKIWQLLDNIFTATTYYLEFTHQQAQKPVSKKLEVLDLKFKMQVITLNGELIILSTTIVTMREYQLTIDTLLWAKL
jgi:hypothetical protein